MPTLSIARLIHLPKKLLFYGGCCLPVRVGESCAVKVRSLLFFASSISTFFSLFFPQGQAVSNTVRFVFEGVVTLFFFQQDQILQMVLKLLLSVVGRSKELDSSSQRAVEWVVGCIGMQTA